PMQGTPPLLQAVDFAGQRLTLKHDEVAGRQGVVVVQGVVDTRKEVGEGGTEVGVGKLADQVLQVGKRLFLDFGIRPIAGGVPEPLEDKAVDLLNNAIDLDPQAKHQGTVFLDRGGGIDHLFANVAGRIGV